MLRYKLNRYPSRKIHYKHLYILKTRSNSLYGIHKQTEIDVSKTSLVVFIDYKQATFVKNYFEKYQENHISYSRILENDTVSYATQVQSTSKMPLNIHKYNTHQLQLLCIMNYFDLLIVNKTEESNNILDLLCFEYTYTDLPSRSMIEYNLRNQLYN